MPAADATEVKPAARARVQHPASPFALSAVFLAASVGLAWFCYSFEPYVNYLPANELPDGISRRQARLAIGKPWFALALGVVVGLCTNFVLARALLRERARRLAESTDEPSPAADIKPRGTARLVAPQQFIPLVLGLIAAWFLEVSFLVFLPAIMIPHGVLALAQRPAYRDLLERIAIEQGPEAAARMQRRTRMRALVSGVFALAAVGVVAYYLAENHEFLAEHREMGLVLKGAALESDAGAELAAALEVQPDNPALRAQALGYYRRQMTPEGQNKHADQVFWIIENRPHARIAGLAEAGLHHREHDGAFAEGSALWQEQVAQHADSADVWANAAYYHALLDEERAMAYLTRALALEPYQRDWQNLMAYLQSPRSRDERRREDEDRPQTLLELPLSE